jgi:curved DNA-binding protein CbpA
MLIHYMILGVAPEASDEEIRLCYIEKVKRYTPEKDPERFQAINAAYDAIKDVRSRLADRYLPPEKFMDLEMVLNEMARNIFRGRQRVGLKDLIRESGGKAAV